MPYKTFSYIPLIPQLTALFNDKDIIELMDYRARYFEPSSDPAHDSQVEHGNIKYVFDGTYYKDLLWTSLNAGGQSANENFFSGRCDIALGLSSDGFAPFKKRKYSAWPLVIFNYNLPPPVCFRLENIICIGVIPGPKAVKDIDSFLVPLVDELIQLAEGVKTFDRSASKYFQFRAHLIKIFGDMPAIAKIMRMKGHNGIKPCRMCNITGVRIPGSCATTHYVPLDRSHHPDCGDVPYYDPADLPLHTHEEMLEQAQEVDRAPNETRGNKLSTEYGINGSSSFHHTPSIEFPRSMPHDFMHLIWENLLKNLIALWTSNYKDLDNSDYEIPDDVWREISKAAAASGSTIPSSFGTKIPDFIARPSEMIAETWSFFTLYLAPILLHGKFKNPVYYHHFIDLVKLINICLLLELTEEQVDELELGFRDWVEEYERCVSLKQFFQHILTTRTQSIL
jgi:hypothetical protein